MKQVKLMQGDNMESLKKLPDNSIDSVVTDPPYGLSFMNKKWDYDVPSVDFWKEVYRVLKPGGHVLSFGGTRTYHRMVVNIEDAGFEIRDQIMWLYGSGFPKSLNVGKSIDKINGELVPSAIKREVESVMSNIRYDNVEYKSKNQFEGWGTALKPANEPICLARKPLSEKSVAENVLKWKTGGINVDGCRVGIDGGTKAINFGENRGEIFNAGKGIPTNDIQELNEGRFPANIILECICDEVIKGEKGEIKKSNNDKIWSSQLFGDRKEGDHYTDKGDIHINPMCPCRLLDEQSGERKGFSGGGGPTRFGGATGGKKIDYNFYNDKGGASRFFYQAKVSKAERNMGLDGFEEKISGDGRKTIQADTPQQRQIHNAKKNFHPTVKPINLMTYLCRLITPEGGIVLDPFMGSGSTGVAAQLEGFRFVGMEMDNDYFKIAEARINSYEKYRKFHKGDQGLKNGNTRMASRNANSISIGLGICKKKKD